MIEPSYVLGVIAAMAGVTFGLRALPFLASRWLQRHAFVQRLGRFLPLAIMSLLLLHSVVDAAKANPAGPWAEGAAIASVLLFQWFKKNALLSMLVGTLLYVALRNSVWF